MQRQRLLGPTRLTRELVNIKCRREEHVSDKSKLGCHAVPRCLFLIICSLAKTKKGVKAHIALETDLYSADIDVTVICETHLKKSIPDANVLISSYAIFRRDRDWAGTDLRAKGGVAIYVRNTLKVVRVERSQYYECINITIELPSKQEFIICGLYHPPKPKYQDRDLMEYLVEMSDRFLDSFPDATVVIGGDLNRLDLNVFSTLSELVPLVDFATQGKSKLDNALTNKPQLFSKCYHITAQIKTDHLGFVLPAGVKLKPFRSKCVFRDSIDHCKEFNKRLALHDSSYLRDLAKIDDIVDTFQAKILELMDECMPLKRITISSRDPPWLKPLVKSLLRKKTRFQRRGCLNHASEIRYRIGQLIEKNRKALATGLSVGSTKWWRAVDTLSNRKEMTASTINIHADELNHYFKNLCWDKNYEAPSPIPIQRNTVIPRITEVQTWKALSSVRKTSSGPDGIPFWVWKEGASALAPIVTAIWNLLLYSQTWPMARKKADINPHPKVDFPSGCEDYRGINVSA